MSNNIDALITPFQRRMMEDAATQPAQTAPEVTEPELKLRVKHTLDIYVALAHEAEARGLTRSHEGPSRPGSVPQPASAELAILAAGILATEAIKATT